MEKVDYLLWDASPEAALSGRYDGYLVTEPVPQPVSDEPGLLTHFSWFPKPSRLTDEEFYRGWQEGHTPTTFPLHPLRRGYVRDAVARVHTPGSPPVRAIVSEVFAAGDHADMSCRPLWRGEPS